MQSKTTGLVPTFTFQDLIPDWWDLKVTSADDVTYLGQVTIEQIILSWHRTVEDIANRIKRVDGLLKFLDGKDAQSIREIASQHVNPTSYVIGLRVDGYGEPEPMDAQSINRQRDTTTFNVCGWCKYASGGLTRYNYHTVSTCEFLFKAGLPDNDRLIQIDTARSYQRAFNLLYRATGVLQDAVREVRQFEAEHPDIDRVSALMVATGDTCKTQRRFSTPCYLQYAEDDQFTQIRQGLCNYQDRLIEEKKVTHQKIEYLHRLKQQVEYKPVLPSHRPHDWFDLNEIVICYVGGFETRLIQGEWATATVVNGYRHHEGYVSLACSQRVHDNPQNLDGRGVSLCSSRPEVMHQWEFDYLLAHPDFATFYATHGVSQHLGNFNAESFLADLEEERKRRVSCAK